MADRVGLKLLGIIFATVTLAVMLTTGMVVKGYADGAYTHLDFARSGWIDGLFRETEFARRNQFGYEQCGYLEPL